MPHACMQEEEEALRHPDSAPVAAAVALPCAWTMASASVPLVSSCHSTPCMPLAHMSAHVGAGAPARCTWGVPHGILDAAGASLRLRTDSALEAEVQAVLAGMAAEDGSGGCGWA